MGVWQIPEGRIVAEWEAHKDEVGALAFTPDGNYLATGSRDRTVRLWRRKSDSFELLLTLRSPAVGPVEQIAFTPDGQQLLTLTPNEYAVRAWHLDKLRQQFQKMGIDW